MEIASTSGAGHDPPPPTADQQGGRTDQEKRQWRRPKRNVEQQQGNPRGPSDDSRPSAPRDGRPPNQRNPRNPTTQSGQNAASWRATTPAGVVDDAHLVQKDDSRSRNYRQRRSKPTYQDSGASTPSSSTVVSSQSEQQPTAPPGVVDNVASTQRNDHRSRNRGQPKPKPADREIGTSTPSASTVVSSQSEQQPTALPIDGLPIQRDNYRSRNPRQQKPKPTNQETGINTPSSSTAVSSQPGHPPRRGAKFGGKLTQPEPSTSGTRPTERHKTKAGPIGDDLASTLIYALSTPPYPDCPICFSPIHPAQPTWSCSPSTPTIVGENEEVQYCWTTFHVKCIRSWASKSVKDIADAWRARGEERNGDWRCPGCQSKREEVPSGYWCFCNSTPEPKPSRLSTPHSCGGPCSRPRESRCGHACPLQCHPGPCPPCQVITREKCYCPHKKVLSFRCGIDGKGKGKAKRDLTCGNVCGRTLGCGKHACAGICHEGDCAKCALRESVRCWCGKEEKEVVCGEGEPVECSVEGETPWIGRFGCDNVCARFFYCGVHKCDKPCHRPSYRPSTCPRSPSKITHCPCGRSTIAPSPSSERSQHTFAARTSCSDPIPTCTSTCSKPHEGCSHPCKATCHTGPCPPCTVEITRPCRCGGTTRRLSCHQIHDTSHEGEILCDRPCTALRACGRHQCRRVCCPLASLAGTSGKKGKRHAGDNDGPGIGEEPGGLHECDLTCEKMLSCGNHRCEERDHKGPCPPCLRSSFEEMACFCGRTVLEPPISCGTQIRCHYPCSRPPLPCGHPGTTHSCHEDPSPCPPCPFLTSKQCACGKKFVANVRCSLERVSCGTTCGKLMACGFHHCESLCHADDCGPCTAPCGKHRKVCLPNHHPCTQPCHAPSSCPETEPCMATVTLTCPCERIKQFAACGRQASHTSGYQHAALKCTSECQIAKRNAQLADALGIRADAKDKAAGTTYHEQVVAFGRANVKFLQVVEKAFAEFISSDKRTQVLPHMPPERRKFVHDLASVYRMDTQMVDQEPHRSVQLLRRLDTRVPSPLLSNVIATSAPPPSLGKLADLRTLRSGGAQSPSWRPALAPTPKPAQSASGGPSRGWTSVVARPSSASASTPLAAPKPTASFGGLSSSSLGASAALTRTPTPTHVAARRDTPVDRVPPLSNNPVPDNWEDDV